MLLSSGLGVQLIAHSASAPGDGKAMLACTLPEEALPEASTWNSLVVFCIVSVFLFKVFTMCVIFPTQKA